MEDTGNQEVTTFTQEEVNKMIEGRLKREREKYADYDHLKEQAARVGELEAEAEKVGALQSEIDSMKAAESLRLMREKVSQETGVPVHLLTGTSEEECTAQAGAIREYATPKYPSVPDGGEVSVDVKKSTREQFEDFAKASLGG